MLLLQVGCLCTVYIVGAPCMAVLESVNLSLILKNNQGLCNVLGLSYKSCALTCTCLHVDVVSSVHVPTVFVTTVVPCNSQGIEQGCGFICII